MALFHKKYVLVVTRSINKENWFLIQDVSLVRIAFLCLSRIAKICVHRATDAK